MASVVYEHILCLDEFEDAEEPDPRAGIVGHGSSRLMKIRFLGSSDTATHIKEQAHRRELQVKWIYNIKRLHNEVGDCSSSGGLQRTAVKRWSGASACFASDRRSTSLRPPERSTPLAPLRSLLAPFCWRRYWGRRFSQGRLSSSYSGLTLRSLSCDC